MQTGSQFKVSSERLEKPGIEPITPSLPGELLHQYIITTSHRLKDFGFGLIDILHENNFFLVFMVVQHY